jgi:hypothetical protein
MSSEKAQQITIQIGSYSNYVGSHFWNFQDEIMRDLTPLEEEQSYDRDQDERRETLPVSYRTERMYQTRGSNTRQLSVTPRALIIDHRGSLGSYNPTGDADANAEISTWNGEKSIISKAKEEKNAFLKMLEQEQNYL